ncbi:NinX [Vibrio phage 1.286.O._10N.286.55.C4]|nr:NinX [Vibrio phage 1.286.O._10N.286.55.C4]
MNYEEWSDFEVNKKVAGIFLPCDYLFDEVSKRVELANYQDVMVGDIHDQVLMPYQGFNPCNDPSDAWPIIIDNKISLYNHMGYESWEATCRGVASKSRNPLRAAMICFLKMKDAEL